MLVKLPLILALFLTNICEAQESSVYQNPVDGKAYVAPGGWNKYLPEQPAAQSSANVKMKNVRLLSDQNEIAQRTSVSELTDYIKSVEKVAVKAFSSSSQIALILVQFESTPGKTDLKIAHQGEISDQLIQEFYDSANKIKPLKVSRDEVKFQVEYQILPNTK